MGCTFLDLGEKGIIVMFDFAEFEEIEGGVGCFMWVEIDDEITEGGL